MRRTAILPVIVSLCSVAIVLGCWASLRRHPCSLPAREETACIKVTHKFWAFKGERTIPAFELPERHWDAVLAALLSCEPDASPKKWECLCDLEVRTAANHSYRVDAYWLDYGGAGAFSVSVDGKFDERTYYRGGNSAQLRDAIIAAFDDPESLNR